MSGTYSNAPYRVQKISITLAILEEFLVNSLFYETEIPMVDMKVQVYSKFSKNEIWEKMKSPNSMKNGRFHTPKCSFKKWECCTSILSKCWAHPHNTEKRKKKMEEIFQYFFLNGGPTRQTLGRGQWATSSCSQAARGSLNYCLPKFSSFFLPIYFCTCQFFLYFLKLFVNMYLEISFARIQIL
jgi:hypothetical protein